MTDWSLYILAGFGGFVLVGFMIVATAAVIGMVRDTRRDRAAHAEKVVSAAYHRQQLRSAAWWFSEHEPTMNLLNNLAEYGDNGARRIWREEMNLPAGKPPASG